MQKQLVVQNAQNALNLLHVFKDCDHVNETNFPFICEERSGENFNVMKVLSSCNVEVQKEVHKLWKDTYEVLMGSTEYVVSSIYDTKMTLKKK